MRAGCERLSDEMPETEALIAVLHDAIDVKEREATLFALWQVVFSDGQMHETEDDLVTLVRVTLGVSPEVCERLRRDALASVT